MNKEQQNMMTLYVGLIISTLLNFVPIASAQFFGFIFFFVLLISAYIYRSKSETGTLQNSHSRYIIKTIWLFSLFLLIGVIAAGLLSDNSLIDSTMEKAMNGVLIGQAELESIITAYMQQNLFTFVITIGPSFGYFIYRLYKGTIHAKNNTPITNLKSWF